MIVGFAHKGLKRFHETGSKAGIQPGHAEKLQRILSNPDVAECPGDMDFPGYRLHEPAGDRQGIWSVAVQANWRVTFRFAGTDVELVNYEDCHQGGQTWRCACRRPMIFSGPDPQGRAGKRSARACRMSPGLHDGFRQESGEVVWNLHRQVIQCVSATDVWGAGAPGMRPFDD